MIDPVFCIDNIRTNKKSLNICANLEIELAFIFNLMSTVLNYEGDDDAPAFQHLARSMHSFTPLST